MATATTASDAKATATAKAAVQTPCQTIAAEVKSAPPVMKALRAKWSARLTPALVGSGLLSDLIGIIAEHALTCPLRWSPRCLGHRVQLMGPLDEDGCSPTVFIEKYDAARPEHKGTVG